MHGIHWNNPWKERCPYPTNCDAKLEICDSWRKMMSRQLKSGVHRKACIHYIYRKWYRRYKSFSISANPSGLNPTVLTNIYGLSWLEINCYFSINFKAYLLQYVMLAQQTDLVKQNLFYYSRVTFVWIRTDSKWLLAQCRAISGFPFFNFANIQTAFVKLFFDIFWK